MKMIPLLLLPFLLQAQSFIPIDIPVYENDASLKNPWTGGLNAPQWASVDLDGDGLNDLFAFDRNGDKPLAFLRQDDSSGNLDFRYDHYAIRFFPDARYFVLMRDFNGDGAPDLFASAFDEFQKSIKVFRGRRENGLLHFDRMTFPELDHDVLHYQEGGEIVDQVKVFLASDYPAIDDLDGDGDLDILSMKQSGDKVYFYKNISLEKGFTMDTLLFELADDCWGKFGLLPDAEGFSLSGSGGECAFFTGPDPIDVRQSIHGGSTLLTLDSDGDGDKDFIYGDLVFPSLAWGGNGGDAENAWLVEQDISYPSENIPVDIPDFPASFHLDVDYDGKRDLIASPNLMEGSPDREVVHFYKNEGTDDEPDFDFETTNLLSEEMLDFGTGAAPAIVDVNADGLLDIVVGNRFKHDGPASLALLLNVGTPDEPEFELTDRDWGDFSELPPEEKAFVPAFGDLDGDGDDDLLIGASEGNVHFAENIAAPGDPMEFAPVELVWKNIDVNRFAAPFIADVNNDGLLDLLIGEQLGTVNYFPNIGTMTEPNFHPVHNEAPNNNFFGEISTKGEGTVVGMSQPFVLDFGTEKQVVMGSFRGWHSRYLVDEAKLEGGAFEKLNSQWGDLREGRYTRIAFANLNDDNFLEAVVGNDRGGLSVFQSPILIDGTVDVFEPLDNEPLVPLIYPNPNYGTVSLVSKIEVEIKVLDHLGRIVFHRVFPHGTHSFRLWNLPAGSYFVHMKTVSFTRTEKMILQPRQ